MKLLIKAVDNKMPTVQEWRNQLNTKTIPEAQALFAAYPDVPAVKEVITKVESYNAALSTLKAVQDGKQVSVEDQTKAALAVSAMVAKPVTVQKIDRARLLSRPTTYEGVIVADKYKFTPGEYEGPSIIQRYSYYKGQVEIEAVKSDAEKAIEIEASDQRDCYKQGDIIEVLDDTKRCVIPPAEGVWIIKVNGIFKEDGMKYMQEHRDAAGNPIRRRLYHVPFALQSEDLQKKLEQDRYAEVESKDIRIINKETLAED